MAYKDDIIDYVNNYYEKYGISPSIREIAEGIVLAKSSVQRYLVQLSEEGKIEYGGKLAFVRHLCNITKRNDVSYFIYCS